MRQLTQHSLQRLLEPRPQSYFYSCPISSTTSPTFTGSEVNQLPFSTAAEICYSCLTGLYTNNEYYFFLFLKPPWWVYLSSPPSLFSCSLRWWQPKLRVAPLSPAGNTWIFHHSWWVSIWRTEGWTALKGCELRSLMLVLELELLVNDAKHHKTTITSICKTAFIS